MVPGAVVAHVVAQQGFDVGEFVVPEGEVADEPLAVGPDVVVFGVFGEHAGEEGEFGGWEGGDGGHDYLAVVPWWERAGLGSSCLVGRKGMRAGEGRTRFGSSSSVAERSR